MGVKTSVTFNGKMLDPSKFRIEHLPNYELSLREFDLVHVEGRVGDIAVDRKTYKNKKRSYSISFASRGPEDFSASCDEIAAWLDTDGYAELFDTYDPKYYYIAVPSGTPTVTSVLNGKAGKVTLDFSCIPKKFLKYGNMDFIYFPEVDTSSTDQSKPSKNVFRLYNPTMYDARPKLVVSFNNVASIEEVDTEIKISFDEFEGGHTNSVLVIKVRDYKAAGNISENILLPLHVDCELENAYCYTNLGTARNANKFIRIEHSDGYPDLIGNSNNAIYIDSGCPAVKSIVVVPRFWVR